MPKRSDIDEESNSDECSKCNHPDYEFFDLFEIFSLTDHHIDTVISEDDLTRRLLEASETAKQIDGISSLGIEDELDTLIRPTLRWQDFYRFFTHQKRTGTGRQNWSSFRTRPLFYGLFMPKKIGHHLNILIAMDSSGSVSKEEATFAISQCQILDEQGEATFVCWDTQVKWKNAVKLKRLNNATLQQLKLIGGGGTNPIPLFQEYHQEVGKVDLILVLTDGVFDDSKLQEVRPNDGTEVCWILTARNATFSPPFGRVFHLRNQ